MSHVIEMEIFVIVIDLTLTWRNCHRLAFQDLKDMGYRPKSSFIYMHACSTLSFGDQTKYEAHIHLIRLNLSSRHVLFKVGDCADLQTDGWFAIRRRCRRTDCEELKEVKGVSCGDLCRDWWYACSLVSYCPYKVALNQLSWLIT